MEAFPAHGDVVAAWILGRPVLCRFAASILLLCVLSGRAWAYAFIGPKWMSTPVTMHLQLGPNSTPLLDGTASWGASAEAALTTWNSHIGGVKFATVRESSAPRAGGNGINNVFFDQDLYGEKFGSGVLAVTLLHYSESKTTECDVVFNNTVTWNAYRGPARYSSSITPIYDFHRVALHEFGHVLGLDHPDSAGQFLPALMNSRVSDLDALASDDIAGGRALYGAPSNLTPTLPPAAATPPLITSQPSSLSVMAGQSATFIVSASSASPPSYQWTKGGVPILGATASVHHITKASHTDAGAYAVVVTNPGGSVTSSSAILTVTAAIAPGIVVHPVAAQSVSRGGSVTFSATVSGTAPFMQQWLHDGTPVPGATSSSFTLVNVQPSHAGNYYLRVANNAGTAASNVCRLEVRMPPTITAEPADRTTARGAAATFTVTASGTPEPSYQWRKDGAPLTGATGATLVFNAVQPADAGNYSVIVSNSEGAVTSRAAKLAVEVPPTITTQPIAQTISAGAAASFTVGATGFPAPTYQWLKDGSAIVGATGASLALSAVQPAHAGSYRVVVSNALGSTTSAPAELGVNFSRLLNLSTRGYVASGGELTPGFVVRGVGAKPVVIRAIGPTLNAFGVDDPLLTPKLAVLAAGAVMPAIANENWSGTSELRDAFASVGAFPLPPDSSDAAARTNLAPNAYTMRITAANPDGSGVALAELYDAGEPSTATRLVNASTLGFAGTGERALTPGFVISGNVPKRLLIRVVGPSLQQFGVPGVLDDPQFQVLPLGLTHPVAFNDDWAGTPELKAAFAQVGAFALGETSADAAVAITLPPGAYSVLIVGANAATGHVLVEIYDLDP